MNIRLVENLHEFLALRAGWNNLLSQSAADTIFLTWEWLSSWWECYAGSDDALYIITVREATGELIGILPLYRSLRPWLPLRPVRTLRFIGDASYDSDYLDAILIINREAEILDSVWNWLSRGHSTVKLFELAGIPESSATCRWLERTADKKAVVSRTDTVACAVTDLPDSWEDYLASLRPRVRTKVRSTLRELTTEHELRFHRIQTDADLKKGLQILYDLHGQRWGTKGGTGVFGSPAKRLFYERFATLFLARGWLAFDFLELNGRPVACQMCFIYGTTQFLLQEGFDPEFASESVGIGLRALVFKKAIEDGVRHYDFLAGIGRHKTQWQARVKHCQTVSLGPRTIQNTIYVRGPVLMRAIRERLKIMLPPKVLEMRRRLAAS